MRLSEWERRRPSAALVVASVALVAALSGVAYATIPSSSGVIYGCYHKNTGQLRVIDPSAGGHCLRNWLPLQWSQTGPQGPAGPTGNTGATGPTGAQGPPGPPGTAAGFDSTTVQTKKFPFPENWAVVADVSLPKGDYYVSGETAFDNNGYENVTECELWATNSLPTTGAGTPFGGLAQMTVFNGDQGEGEATASVSGEISLPAASYVALECIADPYGNYQPPSGGWAGNVLSAHVAALSVGTVTTQ
jgi:hypothetical protein